MSFQSTATSPVLSTIQLRADSGSVKAAKPLTHVAAAVTATDPVSPPGICGNGVLEHGEECDCGSAAECAKDPCCNGKTCKLMARAQCRYGLAISWISCELRSTNCTNTVSLVCCMGHSNLQDCCDKCLFRPSTFVCREATSGCDVVEMCSGKSGKCPSNKKDCPKHHPSSSNATDSVDDSAVACGPSGCSKDQQCRALLSSTNLLMMSCTQDISSCQVSCTSGTEINGSLNCQVLPQYYSDGTECGDSGTCSNGSCIGGEDTAQN